MHWPPESGLLVFKLIYPMGVTVLPRNDLQPRAPDTFLPVGLCRGRLHDRAIRFS